MLVRNEPDFGQIDVFGPTHNPLIGRGCCTQ